MYVLPVAVWRKSSKGANIYLFLCHDILRHITQQLIKKSHTE